MVSLLTTPTKHTLHESKVKPHSRVLSRDGNIKNTNRNSKPSKQDLTWKPPGQANRSILIEQRSKKPETFSVRDPFSKKSVSLVLLEILKQFYERKINISRSSPESSVYLIENWAWCIESLFSIKSEGRETLKVNATGADSRWKIREWVGCYSVYLLTYNQENLWKEISNSTHRSINLLSLPSCASWNFFPSPLSSELFLLAVHATKHRSYLDVSLSRSAQVWNCSSRHGCSGCLP